MTWDAKHLGVIDDSGTAQLFELDKGKPISPPIHLDGASDIVITSEGLRRPGG
jgi:hypothetical protein